MDMKKMLVVLAMITILILGGCRMLKSEPTKEEMIQVLKSEEVIKGIETAIKRLDTQAFTDSGIIRSYEVDYSSVEWNPMESIMYDIYINDNKGYIAKGTINKYNGKLEVGISGLSSGLSELLENNR